ncbi:MAG TPA: hypothetical protein VF989_03615 [Polyangiaceae bacterium]
MLVLAGCQSGRQSLRGPGDDTSGAGGDVGAAATGGTGGVGGGSGSANGGTGAVSEPGVTFIQEDELGFSAVDGLVLPRQGSTSVTGYTGTGFCDGDPGIGTAIGWSVAAERAGPAALAWRYAFGGTETNLRDATLLVNGAEVALVEFPYTVTWNDWQETPPLEVDLDAGPNFIQLVAVHDSGLGNVDYLKLLGEGILPSAPRFTLDVAQNDEEAGAVSYSPVQDFYEQGTNITLYAEANAGYFFQSWTGEVTSDVAEHTFSIEGNTAVSARFLPEGAEQDPDLVGYATVQDDDGTPYLVTGGSLGEMVTATTLEELKEYLESPEPYVVSFSGTLEAADEIQIASDKTLLGVGDSAHLVGVELEINGSRNVIVRNVTVSHVVADGAGVANDAIVITGGAKNVWIDHCDLFSDLDNGADYYDGLLEIKNRASFITVSWTVFHDHYKASLISSGDEQVGDTVIRATYHHNFFRNCGSRMPSIRFGKAHVFNNYYLDNDFGTGVNTRMGAVVRVEHNYFLNSEDPIVSRDSATPGTWDVVNNVFDACSGEQPTESTGSLTVPYAYEAEAPEDVPDAVAEGAGVGKL